MRETMNKDHEKLIARHMAGEDVSEELLAACRGDQQLLDELSGLTAVERLMVYHAEEESPELFAAEVKAKLEGAEDADAFTSMVHDRLLEEVGGVKLVRFPLWFKLAAAAALVLMITFFMPSQKPVATLSNSVAAVFLDADTDCLSIIGNDIRGDYSTACIVGDTAASTDILLLNNMIVNGAMIGDGGLNTEPAIELLDSTAGVAHGNVFAGDVATGLAIRVADDLCFIENWIADSDGDDKAGAMESTSATITVFVDGG